MQRKILAFFLVCLLFITGCGQTDNSVIAEAVIPTLSESIASTEIQTEPPTEPVLAKEERIDQLADDGIYMLKWAFVFYQGTVDMSEITTIMFTDTVPEEYDECWLCLLITCIICLLLM